MDRKIKKKMFLMGVVTLICTVVCLIMELGSLRVNTVERNGHGKGDKQETYKVTVGDVLEKEPLEIEVGEEEYTVEEIRKVFKQTMDKLEKIVLAENRSAGTCGNKSKFDYRDAGFPDKNCLGNR